MNEANQSARLRALRTLLAAQGVDAALLSLYENRRYFSGFTGSNGYLIVTENTLTLITDRRYTQQAEEQTRGVRIIEHGADRFALIAREIQSLGLSSLMIESAMPVSEYFALCDLLPGLRIRQAGEKLLDIRMVKDDEEIDAIRTAVRMSERAFSDVAALCRIGMTEKELADELHDRVSRQGAEAMSFGTIVATGERGALAHGSPTQRRIAAGEMVVIDFGAMWNGYCADLTRTLLFGNVPAECLQTFALVEQAFQAALAAVRPGVSAAEVEEAHRRVFREANMEEYALKGLGHGIGLEIHEHPRVVIAGTHTLQPGMVFTIEPGLYLPGRYGVRTEDDVLVTATGATNLCSLPHRICITQ